MKTMWGEMSAEMDKQKKLTTQLITKMTQANYRGKVNNILMPETAGALVSFASFVYIALNFEKLNSLHLFICGIVAAAIMLVLPLLSLRAVFKMRSVNIGSNNFKQAIQQYAAGKKQFVFVQKLTFYLGALLLVAILPVMSKIMGNVDAFKTNSLWLMYAVMFIFFLFFAKWVYRSYAKSVNDAENLLKELSEES